VCITTLYIQDDLMIVFTMAFKSVLKILKTCVNFTGLQVENYFCSRKMFTSRKLTGVETMLQVSITFQLNENTRKCIANSGQSDCISHPNTLTHKNILYIYIYIYSEIITSILEEFSISSIWNMQVANYQMSRCSRITKLHSLLFETTVMTLHIIMTYICSTVGRMS